MKKLAIPVEGGKLSQHFGHSRMFMFFDISNGEVLKSYSKEPPPHTEGAIPNWLSEEECTDLLVNGIGPKAIKILNDRGINVVSALEINTPETLVTNFLNAKLEYGESHCNH